MIHRQMEKRSALRLAPVASRIVLVLATILLARIGSRYVVDPGAALAHDGITLQSVGAATAARVGFGAFPLAIAMFSLGSVFVARALTSAVSLIAIVMATAFGVRIADIAAHHGVVGNLGPLMGEGVFLVLSVIVLVWTFANRAALGKDA